MSAPILDAEAVLGDLRQFQRATADWVYERMFDENDPAHRFLVADEVGLGKTHVAKGVVAKVIEHLGAVGDRRHDIVYVCSNAAIARQNLRKLVPRGIEPIDNVERLTMLPTADLNASGVNLLAITPGTSLQFGHSTGKMSERALAYTFLREAWGSDSFSKKRARWIFWEGAPKQGDEALKKYVMQYDWRIRDAVPAFVEELDLLDASRAQDGRQSLREAFDELVDGLAYQRSFPSELKRQRREFIGDVRRAMATVGIQMLEPDLVILDEFQRFKDLLEPADDSWAAQLARRLFTHRDSASGRHTKTLLLSATPYRMYTLSDEEGEDHYRDFVSTASFLLDDEERVDRLQIGLRELRLALTKPGGLDRAEEMCRRVETQLRTVMSRTERLAATPDRSGMLVERQSEVRLHRSDVEAYRVVGDLAEAVGHHQPTEYWKSSPYLVNFMEGYKLKQGIQELARHEDHQLDQLSEPGPGRLDWDAVDTFEPIDPENGRLRWLLDDLEVHGAFEVLWIPASMPYYAGSAAYERAHTEGLTKRLVFSGWTVVPKAVSALVSYEAERRVFSGRKGLRYTAPYRARGGQRLDFGTDRQTGRADSMNSLLLLWPSPTLAELGDPRPFAGRRLSHTEVEREIEARIAEVLAPLKELEDSSSSGVDQRWYWAAPLLLDGERHPAAVDDWFGFNGVDECWTGGSPAGGFLRHLDEAWALVSDESPGLGRMPADLAVVLARVALGSPSVCAYRSIRSVAGTGVTSAHTLGAAARASWGFRTYFNGPDVTALVDQHHARDNVPYWQLVIEHGIAGNLQAMLDEHAHILRDWLGFVTVDDDNRKDLAVALGQKIHEALEIRTTTHRVDVPRRENGSVVLDQHGMRCRFAVPFGTHRMEDGGEARVESVSTGFNSPFWPFVLTSTSVGQEGLDFHLWCHAVVHWNLPGNPVDLEQREGRVHRYKGHAVRRNLAHQLANYDLDPSTDVWEQLYEAGRSEDSEMVPLWICNDGPARIERLVPVLPFSRDAAHLPRLRQTLAAYRLAMGQPRQEELVEFLTRTLPPDEIDEVVRRLRIDLTPPMKGEAGS